MCGISGWFSWGSKRPTANTIRGLLLANQERGVNATGMAWLGPDGVVIRKGKGPAAQFIEQTPDDVFIEAVKSPRGLLHTRATTKGSEDENANNHPVYGLDWLVVHNGTVMNDDDLWGFYSEKEGITRFAEVDTSVIPLLLSRGTSVEDSIKKLSALSGSATIAAWSEKYPEQMLLGRFGHNDLHLFYDAGINTLFWSSAASAAYVMKGTMMGRHKFLTLSRLADQHVLLLSPDGMDGTRTFKLTQRPFHAVRKEMKRQSSLATTTTPPALGNRESGRQRTYEETLPARPPSPGSSGSPPTSMDSWVAVNTKDRQTELAAGKDYVRVLFKAPHDALMVSASWRPIELTQKKPFPMSDVFTKSWWSLDMILRLLKKDPVVKEVTKETAYGRWVIGAESLAFYAHKRTKEWWHRVYGTKFFFPLVLKADGKTELDYHCCWEHYDIQIQKTDKSSHSFLGFMCPWCGVWMSSTLVQSFKYRCEFCGVYSRTQAVAGTEGARG